MKAIKHEILEELETYENKAKSKELDHEDVDTIKDLCETLYALDEIEEIWKKHKQETPMHHDSDSNPHHAGTHGSTPVYPATSTTAPKTY